MKEGDSYIYFTRMGEKTFKYQGKLISLTKTHYEIKDDLSGKTLMLAISMTQVEKPRY